MINAQYISEIFESQKSHKYSIQFARSIVVSFAALAVNFGGSFILKEILGLFYLLAASISYCAGVVVNYYLSTAWVFANRKLNSARAEFAIFTGINLVGLGLNTLIIAFIVEALGQNYWTALTIATVLVFLWNFIARKKVLY